MGGGKGKKVQELINLFLPGLVFGEPLFLGSLFRGLPVIAVQLVFGRGVRMVGLPGVICTQQVVCRLLQVAENDDCPCVIRFNL